MSRTITVRASEIPEIVALVNDLNAENHLLANLLDGVMADNPQAIRDAAAWLVTWDARQTAPAAPYSDADGETVHPDPQTAERPTTARKDNA